MSRKIKKIRQSEIPNRKVKKIKMKCMFCDNQVDADSNVKSVMCWECVNSISYKPRMEKVVVKSTKVRGWKFMAEFVDQDGTVYHKGIEQPKLKGKRPITNVDAIRSDQKKNRADKKKAKQLKEEKRQQKLVNDYKKKVKLKNNIKKQKEKKIKQLTTTDVTDVKPIKRKYTKKRKVIKRLTTKKNTNK